MSILSLIVLVLLVVLACYVVMKISDVMVRNIALCIVALVVILVLFDAFGGGTGILSRPLR